MAQRVVKKLLRHLSWNSKSHRLFEFPRYTLRYFQEYVAGLWIKRWRCPDCGAVHTARPADFIPGMQYPKVRTTVLPRSQAGGQTISGDYLPTDPTILVEGLSFPKQRIEKLELSAQLLPTEP